MSDRILTSLRMGASGMALIAYGLLTHGLTTPGVLVALIGQLTFIPWSVRHKVWDMVALTGFYIAISLAKLLHGAVA